MPTGLTTGITITTTGTTVPGTGRTFTVLVLIPGTVLTTVTAAGTAHGMIPIGRTTVGLVHSLSITDTVGTTDGVVITTIGTVLITAGIPTADSLMGMAWVTAAMAWATVAATGIITDIPVRLSS